jgi:hypothetical protein
MTKFGKLLVYFNIIASIGLMMLAISVYAGRLDWNSRSPTGGEKIVGKIEANKKRIDELAFARDRAEMRWFQAYSDLVTAEGQRPLRQIWFAKQLEIIRSGKLDGNAVNPPVQQLEYAGGQLSFERPSGRAPVVFRDAPLKDIASLTELKRLREKDTVTQQAEIDRLIQEHKKLTADLNGLPQVGAQVDLRTVGLYKLRDFQVQAKQGYVQQQEDLKPLLANAYAEAQSLLRRQIALQSRKAELEKAGTAAAARVER